MESDSGLGLVLGADLFIGREPTKPDEVVVIFDTPSYPPAMSISGEEHYVYSSLQIRVRGNEYLATYNIAENIKNYLHGRANFQLGGVLYTNILCTTPPALLDWDNGKVRIIINLDLQRR
jgi:hypothetical protein